jgi:hypothetical protein
VKVDGFKQSLRRSLLNSHPFRNLDRIRYRRAFFLSTSVAAVFAAILVLFIYQPVIPGRVHYALVSHPDSVFQKQNYGDFTPGDGTLYNARADVHDYSEADRKDTFEHMQTMLARNIDKEFVRYLAEREYKTSPVDIEPFISGELYSVNRFRLNNGRDALVYTQVPAKQVDFRESY